MLRNDLAGFRIDQDLGDVFAARRDDIEGPDEVSFLFLYLGALDLSVRDFGEGDVLGLILGESGLFQEGGVVGGRRGGEGEGGAAGKEGKGGGLPGCFHYRIRLADGRGVQMATPTLNVRYSFS